MSMADHYRALPLDWGADELEFITISRRGRWVSVNIRICAFFAYFKTLTGFIVVYMIARGNGGDLTRGG
jgi:hypothetical protein